MDGADDLPRIAPRQRLVRCDSCGEFVFDEDRECPICHVDRAMMTLAMSGNAELLQAIIAHYEAKLREEDAVNPH